jgi:hypothetical protein
MKIKTKLILVPVLASLTYLIIFIVNTSLGSQNGRLLVAIETGYLPALEMSRSMEDILGSIQRNIEYAAATQDEKVLGETDIFHDKFLMLLENNRHNPILQQGELDSIENLFSRYYPLARQTTIRMISEGLKDDILQNLDTMQQDYNRIKEKLAATTARQKTDMSN